MRGSDSATLWGSGGMRLLFAWKQMPTMEQIFTAVTVLFDLGWVWAKKSNLPWILGKCQTKIRWKTDAP
jgi:hypothetical protein